MHKLQKSDMMRGKSKRKFRGVCQDDVSEIKKNVVRVELLINLEFLFI